MNQNTTLEATLQKTPTRPNFPGILSGIWKLTWKSQLTWKKIYGVLINILGLPVLSYFSFSFGDGSDAFLRFLVDFYMLLALPLICLTAFGGMVRDELQEDTVCFLLTRPMKRWQFFLSKYISHLIWTQIIGTLTLLAFAVAGTLRGVDDTPMLVFSMLKVQFLAIMAYGAISSLMGLATKKYLVLGLVYGFVVEFGIGSIPTNVNTLAMTNHLKSIMTRYQPLAEHLDYDPGRLITALFALVITTAIFLALSSVLFTLREYNHSDEMSK